MYESPITIIESAIDSFQKGLIKEKEDAIIFAVQKSLGVDVDRGELLRAMQYDRFQYEKGYADGKADAMAELVRCKDCKYYGCELTNYIGRTEQFCKRHVGLVVVDRETFCSYGERKDNERKAD